MGRVFKTEETVLQTTEVWESKPNSVLLELYLLPYQAKKVNLIL